MSRLIYSSKQGSINYRDIDKSIRDFRKNEGEPKVMTIPETMRDKARAIQQNNPGIKVVVAPIKGDRIWLNDQSQGL